MIQRARDAADRPPRPPEPPTAPSEAPAVRPRLTSASLLAGHTEIEIEHANTVYRLRLTSLGKLILTK